MTLQNGSNSSPVSVLIARAGSALSGKAIVPGDKSLSHRALILGALSVGETVIHGLLEGEDVLKTAHAMAALGAQVERWSDDSWHVHGLGVGGFTSPPVAIDFGNSGTGVRLTLGAAATTALSATFTGDASLSRRPMARVTDPLTQMGAAFAAAPGGRLPLTLTGTGEALPLTYRLPVASAQVKSAVLLAGLNAPGETTVIEPAPTRDHTERMLRLFGAKVGDGEEDGARAVTVTGEVELRPQTVHIAADPSSAAFPLVAALIVPGSQIRLPGVLVNPLRAGLLETLRDMGAKLTLENQREESGEPVANLVVEASALKGIEVPPERAPSMIDEYPVLAVAAAFAQGKTVMRGLEELRVKESDRLAATAAGLKACGIEVEELEDGLIVHGRGADGVPGGGTVHTQSDHRIAMAFLVMGLASAQPVRIDDGAMIATSFPGFTDLMGGLGAVIEIDGGEGAPG